MVPGASLARLYHAALAAFPAAPCGLSLRTSLLARIVHSGALSNRNTLKPCLNVLTWMYLLRQQKKHCVMWIWHLKSKGRCEALRCYLQKEIASQQQQLCESLQKQAEQMTKVMRCMVTHPTFENIRQQSSLLSHCIAGGHQHAVSFVRLQSITAPH